MRIIVLGTCAIAFVVMSCTLWASQRNSTPSVRQLLDNTKQPLTPGFEACDRSPNNEALATFAKNAVSKVCAVAAMRGLLREVKLMSGCKSSWFK